MYVCMCVCMCGGKGESTCINVTFVVYRFWRAYIDSYSALGVV